MTSPSITGCHGVQVHLGPKQPVERDRGDGLSRWFDVELLGEPFADPPGGRG